MVVQWAVGSGMGNVQRSHHCQGSGHTLLVSPSNGAAIPPVMPNLPRFRLYDLLECSGGDWSIVFRLKKFLVSLVCLLCHFLEYHNVQESIGWMFLRLNLIYRFLFLETETLCSSLG